MAYDAVMLRVVPHVLIALALATGLCWLWFHADAPSASASALSSEVYLWQRVHTAAVSEAVKTRGPDFASVVVLAAQITWNGDVPAVQIVDLDRPALAALNASGTGIGLALRITEFSGSFAGKSATDLSDLAEHLIETTSPHFPVRELQLDFDCPTRRLEDYRLWVEALKTRLSCPITITALPTWLTSRAFAPLARSTDGFVLQVHSLEKPRGFDQPATLCDADQARAAVVAAGRLGVPYRVALPTYGYTAAFNSSDRFIGLSAEGPSPTWPKDVRTREIRSDPATIAQLVSELRVSHPASLTGLIYYRLPIATDQLNWAYPTLGAVMRGKTPRPYLKLVLRHPRPELNDIILQNSGDADAVGPVAVQIACVSDPVVALDAGNGFNITQSAAGKWICRNGRPLRVRPGDELAIGWLRVKSAGAQLDVQILKEP